MVESRCGLLCSSCTFREPCNCGGCIETNGRPFHGECPIAACCQAKGHEHCGQCFDMPCKKLYAYSFLDREHGDNPPGARLEFIEKWALEGDMESSPLYLKAAKIMKEAPNATIAVIDEEGRPIASTISNTKTDGIKIVWLSTTLASGKARSLSKNNRCSLCYSDGRSNVTLQGTAEVLTDPDTKRRLWIDWYEPYYTGGAEDPAYCILKFVTEKATFHIGPAKEEFCLSGIT